MTPETSTARILKTQEIPRAFTPEEISTAATNLEENDFSPETAIAEPAAEQNRIASIDEVKARLETTPVSEPAATPEVVAVPAKTALEEFRDVQAATRNKLRVRYENNPKEAQKLEKNFDKAVRFIQEGRIDKANKLFGDGEQLSDIIGGEIKFLVESGDAKALKKIAENNDLMGVHPDNLALLPLEIRQSPKVQAKIRKRIEQGFFVNPVHGLEMSREATTGERIREFQKLGLLTPSAAREIVDSPRFQKDIEKDIRNSYKRRRKGSDSSNPSADTLALLQNYINEGLVTPERAKEIRRKVRI